VSGVEVEGVLGVVADQEFGPAVVVEVGGEGVDGAPSGDVEDAVGGVAVGAAEVDEGLVEADAGAGVVVDEERARGAVGIADEERAAGVLALEAARRRVELAVLEGESRGYREFLIYGGTGGRADHSFANYSLLLFIAKRGMRARLVGVRDEALVIVNGSIELPKTECGKYFSVFAFGGEALGVSIKNAKYEVENLTLTPDFPLGVSNEFCDTPPTVSVNFGSLLVIFEKNS